VTGWGPAIALAGRAVTTVAQSNTMGAAFLSSRTLSTASSKSRTAGRAGAAGRAGKSEGAMTALLSLFLLACLLASPAALGQTYPDRSEPSWWLLRLLDRAAWRSSTLVKLSTSTFWSRWSS
jgi:hypothetical protein